MLDRDPLFWGYPIGAVLMFLGGLTAYLIGALLIQRLLRGDDRGRRAG